MKKIFFALAFGLCVNLAIAKDDTVDATTEYNTANEVNKVVKFLSEQLWKNENQKNTITSTIAITSFVNMENLKETNKLGNYISESLMHDMQIRGYRIIDFKLMPNIKVNKQGDYIYSRESSQLAQNLSANYILTGTYTNFKEGCTINARLVNPKTQIVESSAQVFIPKKLLKDILDDYIQVEDRKEAKSNQPRYIIPDVEPNIVEIKSVDTPSYMKK